MFFDDEPKVEATEAAEGEATTEATEANGDTSEGGEATEAAAE